MASTKAAATLYVDEIAAMSDLELGHFMTKHGRPDGGYELPVGGWDKLSKDERNRLAERLKVQERGLAQSPTTCSPPLDLDDLDARLRQVRQVSPNESFSLRPDTQPIDRSRSPTPPLDPTRYEIEAYHELINDSGRPLYPIDLMKDVYRDPDNYAETLRPWQESLSQIRVEGIFQRQLQRWQDFHKWQNDNRGYEDADGDFLAYVEQEKHRIKIHCLRRSRAKLLAEIEADPSCLKLGWDVQQSLRERQRRLYREHNCRGFHDYAEAVKRRLTRHDFIQPFELNEDPKKQNKLTTWIEYLNYEYWWLDKYSSDIKLLEPEHDKLWQELVNKKVLRPHETKEFVRTDASGMECEAEKDQAMKAVQRAESEAKRIYVLTQEDPKRFSIPKAKRISMLRNGAEKLLGAKRRLEQARSRSHLIVQFVRATFGYAGAKRNASRHRVLIQWVLDQVPLIEAEVNLSNANRSGSDGRRTKRGRTADDEPAERRTPKRARVDPQKSRLATARALSNATETQLEPSLVMDQEAGQESQPENVAVGCLHQSGVQATSQGCRRSARIAARRDTFRIALEPNMTQPRPRSESGAPPARPPRSHSLEDTKAHITRRQLRSGSQGGIIKTTQRSQRCPRRRRG